VSGWRVVVGVVLISIQACGGATVDTELPELDLFVQPVPDAPDPADRAGAAAAFVECTYPLGNGGWSSDFGPPPSGSSPDGGLQAFVDEGLFGLPPDGYVPSGRDGDRVLFTYSVAEVPKVAVIIADEADGWRAETFATCDPAEYDPSRDGPVGVWTDAEGHRVPTSTIMSLQGAEHCGWESVTYLLFEDRQYIGDPEGAMDVPFAAPFSADTQLPSDALDTGYERDGAHLFMSSDTAVAYLVFDDHVEAWPTPAVPDPVWCA